MIMLIKELDMYPAHETDVYGWAIKTAQLLKDRKMDEVDFEGIIEEIESLGRSERQELINRLSLVISHLLKWQYQPTMRGHSWIYTIKEQRKKAKIHIRDNPSLKSQLDGILEDSYDISVYKAARETGLEEKVFPSECPYTFEQIIDDEFFPE